MFKNNKKIIINKNKIKSRPTGNKVRGMIHALLIRIGRAFVWQSGVKTVRAGMGPFIAIGSLLAGRVNPSLVLGVFALLRSIVGLLRAQGPKGTAVYLKACTMYLYRYVGQEPLLDRAVFGPTISLTRSGIPRIIPPVWRRGVRSQTVWIIRLILTIFGLYRVLDFPGKLNTSSIVKP